MFAPTTSSRRRSTLGTPLDEREEVQEEEEKEEKENVVFSEKDQRDIKSRSWVHGHHDEKAHSPGKHCRNSFYYYRGSDGAHVPDTPGFQTSCGRQVDVNHN